MSEGVISDKWKPWTDSPVDAPAAMNKYNGMKGPPCSFCLHWNPQVAYRPTPQGFVGDGIVCCHAEEMHPDFSCFKDGSAEDPLENHDGGQNE